MKQIYNFEQSKPPVLNERLLRKEMEKRKNQRDTMMLTIAVILIQITVIMLGVLTYEMYPIVTLGCVFYVGITTISSGAVAIAFTMKRRSLVCQ